jgi:hypothetical protein
MDTELTAALRKLMNDITRFSALAGGLRLRAYQSEVALAITRSVLEDQGLSFVIIFPRQSGKNELQAQIEAYLLLTFSHLPVEMVKISPTWKPQSQNAQRRLERVLQNNWLTSGVWRKEQGYIYRLGAARMIFLSGAPESNIVGATASKLLEVDEAQDVLIEKYDKEIAPMAASTNATRVFWGTAWTNRTLLGREARAARTAEAADGQKRVFVLDAGQVAAEVPAYGQFVAEQVARLGRSHPLVRTQFFSEEINDQGGLFPETRRQRMLAQPDSENTRLVYTALLMDVAGEEEGTLGLEGCQAAGQRRDATALTVVALESHHLPDWSGPAWRYRVLARHLWLGVKHSQLYGQLSQLVRRYAARYVVIDATGVGAGLASFLGQAYPGRVLPFVFSASSKSKLGWDFLAIVDAGRWCEGGPEDLQAEFFKQLSFCDYQVSPGPEKLLHWGVPEGARDPNSGDYVHDDLVISAALAAVLEDKPAAAYSPSVRGQPLLSVRQRGKF